MKGPSVTVLKKYLNAINKSKVKYMTCERLSHIVGVYPEIIADQLSYFEPMLKMDDSFDLLIIVPLIKQYIQSEEDKKINNQPKIVATKKQLLEYESVSDFVYKKMTFGGMVDRNYNLSEKDLKILRRLVVAELAELKKEK